MARAKRTDRAEARRRYRQTSAAEEAEYDDLDEDPTAGPSAAGADRRPSRPGTPSSAPGARPSIAASFRAAYAPAPIRDDLRALPGIVLRTKAFWVPAGLAVASGVAYLVGGAETGIVGSMALALFLQPPPMAASFLGGILAPRAAWAIGGLVGLTSAIVLTVVVLLYPDATTGTGAEGSQSQDFILFALLVSPTFGVAVGAFAGFYRRFLQSTRPTPPSSNRQRRAATRR